jgi:hypothetical protein
MADIELAHGRMYVAALRGLTDGLREEIDAGGPTHAQIDPDTSPSISTPGTQPCARPARRLRPPMR